MRIATKHGKPWIFVPPLKALPKPPNLPALHAEIERRHGMIDLLDVLKEADHLSGFTRKLISVASREITDADTARGEAAGVVRARVEHRLAPPSCWSCWAHSGRPGPLLGLALLGTGLASLPASGSSKPSRSGGVRPYDPVSVEWIVLGSAHHDLGRGV